MSDTCRRGRVERGPQRLPKAKSHYQLQKNTQVAGRKKSLPKKVEKGKKKER